MLLVDASELPDEELSPEKDEEDEVQSSQPPVTDADNGAKTDTTSADKIEDEDKIEEDDKIEDEDKIEDDQTREGKNEKKETKEDQGGSSISTGMIIGFCIIGFLITGLIIIFCLRLWCVKKAERDTY